MNEEQAQRIIDLLESIDSRLNQNYDASDICSKLDDVRSDLDTMKSKFSDAVLYLGNIDNKIEC